MFPKEMLVVAFVAVVVLYFICKFFTERAMRSKKEREVENGGSPAKKNIQHTAEDCAEGGCGMRAICNGKEEEKPEYFEDEELDRFKDRDAENYSDDEVAEFREVMLTLQQHEVAPWLNSLCARGVSLPKVLRQEAIALVNKNKK